MTLSLRAKIVIGLMSLVGIFAFLIVVDMGISAGRIHHGVHVRDIDVGGLTYQEAYEVLREEGLRLQSAPVILTRENTDCRFSPTELGWDPRADKTATSAYRVGRGTSWVAALGTRARAWVSRATIDWTDEVDQQEMTEFLDWCEERVAAAGYELRRYKMRRMLLDTIKTWPRVPVTIPVYGRS